MEILSWLIVIISLSSTSYAISDDEERKVYIVYMGDCPKDYTSASALHINMLQEVADSGAAELLLHSYHRSFNGFVAKLTKSEKKKIAGMKSVVSVFPNGKKKLHTTRSWDFMGFHQDVARTGTESDIIVGVIDTGIWPESQSFSDEGFSPPPKNWKGYCQESSNFTCNNKIIGARYYHIGGDALSPGDISSPRDSNGHGSHIASTAAGNIVSHASLFGLASGIARGGVPRARIAIYKTCWTSGCIDADILAAFDDAIADGVNIITISIGRDRVPLDYFKDAISIGAFHSMKNEILTTNSAGNRGPHLRTLINYSPWSLSVAASTIDRKFTTKIKLGNGASYEGVSINTIKLNRLYPVIYGGDAPNLEFGFNETISRYCNITDSLNTTLVKGKIVLCDVLSDGEVAVAAGAIGTVIRDDKFKDVAFNYPVPASHLDIGAGLEVFEYVNRTRNPTATIFTSTERKDELAPTILSFSSRGPNPITSDILKPDITAPGVDILAAWTRVRTVTGFQGDKRVVPYNLLIGTSYACSHATGAAAYILSFHATWSPAAIRSALMTTALPMSADENPGAEFAYGSGHINPIKSINPGLIYDAGVGDYVQFLCGQGYSTQNVRLITGDITNCSEVKTSEVWDLNYPSFTLSAKSGQSTGRVFHRIVTNVGLGESTYRAVVKAPVKLKITVTPKILHFSSIGEKKSFVVSVIVNLSESVISGTLIWEDGIHHVRSPIVAYTYTGLARKM